MGKVRVSSLVDLTQYHSNAKKRALGWTSILPGDGCSPWARGSHRFTLVELDDGGGLDVHWKSLEVVRK